MLKQVCRLTEHPWMLFTCTKMCLVYLQFSVPLGIFQSLGSRLLLFWEDLMVWSQGWFCSHLWLVQLVKFWCSGSTKPCRTQRFRQNWLSWYISAWIKKKFKKSPCSPLNVWKNWKLNLKQILLEYGLSNGEDLCVLSFN